MNPVPATPVSCPACGPARHRRSRWASTDGNHALFVCVDCGLAQMRPVPAENEDHFQSTDAGVYAAHVAHLAGGFSHHHRLLLTDLRRLVPPPGRLLEIGSAGGAFLRAAREAGYDAWGVEPAAERSFEEAGLRVIKEKVEQAKLPEATFDAAVAVQVIEHLVQPRRFLEMMARALKPGGILFVETPNYGALARRLGSSRFMSLNVGPGHWHLFNRRNLGELFRQQGLVPLRSWTFFKALSAYERGRLRPLAVSALNGVLGPLGLGNTLAVLGQKSQRSPG